MHDEVGAAPRTRKLPERLSIAGAVANLRTRLDYARHELGLSLEVISKAAGLSEKALRYYDTDGWNPGLRTLLKVDETLAMNLATWDRNCMAHA
jgi:DNA-binding phage protein